MPEVERTEENLAPSSAEVTFATLPPTYVPARGLFLSSIFHELLIFAILFLATHDFGHSIHRRPRVSRNERQSLVYLPVLGGGHEGSGHVGGGSGVPWRTSLQLPARSSKGLSYPGKQPLLSNPPNPLNFNQTLLHSGLKNLPVLRKFVPLPNLVESTNAAPPVPMDLRHNKTSIPRSHLAQIAPPQIELSAKTPQMPSNAPILPRLQKPEAVRPLAKNADAPQQPTKQIEKIAPAPRASQLPTRGAGEHGIVALSPTPVAPAPTLKIPLAETRGQFAVSPEANTASASPAPGSKSTGPEAPVIGNSPTAPLGNAAAEVAAGNGNNRSLASSGGGGKGTGSGTGDKQGAGNGGTSSGTGHGEGAGSALGTGAGVTAGSGTGSGSGHGGGSFPGITIQGGRLEGGTAPARPHGATPVPAQTSYGMTIVSTAGSGGGLPDYGVFSNQKVFTVYLDARKTTDDPSIAWTLQYAPLPEAEGGSNVGAPTGRGITPPYAISKEIPRWPPELASKYPDRVVVVSAVITTEGKLDQMLIVQSPDDALTEGITEALNKWSFRPAQLNGHPVAIKIMLGIPLSQ